MVMVFLYNFFNKVIYVEQPYLFLTEQNIVCMLIMALYKPKQPSHIWYKTSVNFLQNWDLFN